MINDMRDLLGMKVDVNFIDHYSSLPRQQWAVRLIDIVDRSDSAHAQGRIGPDIARTTPITIAAVSPSCGTKRVFAASASA